MPRLAGTLSLLAMTLGPACTHSAGPPAPRPPDTRMGEDVLGIHGQAVPDPYRWLEDLDAPEVRAWIAAQNAATEAFLAASPQRDGFRRRLERGYDFVREGPPVRRGGRLVFTRNEGLQDQAVHWWSEGEEGEPQVLIDPNAWSADGSLSVATSVLSEDGAWLAYGVSRGGSDWNEVRIRRVATGEDLPEVLRWVKFSEPCWHPDGSGFFYARYPEPEPGTPRGASLRNQRLHFHRIGTPQESDPVVFERPDEPEWGFAAQISDDHRTLVITSWVGTDRRRRIFLRDLEGGPVRPWLDAFDASYEFLGNDGDRAYVRTDRDAPRGRIVAISMGDPNPERWATIVPEGSGAISTARLVQDRILVQILEDVRERVLIFDTKGSLLGGIPLPEPGTVGAWTTHRPDPVVHLSFQSFVHPPAIYRYDVASGSLGLRFCPRAGPDPDSLVVEQVRYASRDGTLIPMYLVHRRDLDPARPARTWLYGYGGFGIPILPAYSVAASLWIEDGGIWAQPALRGGGEFGKAWHEAGMLDRKQNVFDDFIAAAEHLIATRRTTPGRLVIDGASNGGLLVGAVLTQRPELFGAALPAVGVLDMLRYERFTIGWAWASEYGSVADEAGFAVLRAYSPLHNLRPGRRYPPTLVTTGDHDDRVWPAHSFKFAAALQAAQGGPGPCLLRVATEAGHGAGSAIRKVIAEAADRLTFADLVLDR